MKKKEFKNKHRNIIVFAADTIVGGKLNTHYK